MTDAPFVIYLLCFEHPLGAKRHYLGSTTPGRLAARLREHAMRRGSRFTAALAARNHTLELARTWPAETRERERQIKRQGGYYKHCPLCQSGDRSRALLSVPCPPLIDLHRDPLALQLGPVLDE